MAPADRMTVPVPYGHHVYVVSDLSLSPSTSPNEHAVRKVSELLNEIDDAAIVIVAGNLFGFEPTSDPSRFVRATLRALPSFSAALHAFSSRPAHRLIVIPGSDDHELAEHDDAVAVLSGHGAQIARDVILQVATADGVRDLAVAAGSYPLEHHRVERHDRDDARHLENPSAVERFVTSRLLYRRLAPWLWLPLIAIAFIDLWSSLLAVIGHLSRHRFIVRILPAHGFWTNLLIDLLIVGALETFVAGLAALIVRKRFTRDTPRTTSVDDIETLMSTAVGGRDVLELARHIGERGGAGAVVGGAPRSALAFLDRGVAVATGPSREVVVEHEGRLGLPPVFRRVSRCVIVEIEAASTVLVRLFGSEVRLMGPFTEKLVAGPSVTPAMTDYSTLLGSWPTGNPYPLEGDRLHAQRRQRSVRRWASGAIFVDGLINVAVTAIPPLRGRLHVVLSLLPLGVAQSAAAVTAIAGIAMIMLARGVRRGQHRAWALAAMALAVTTVAHLLRGGTVISSLIAASILALLVVGRRHFRATTDHASARGAFPRLALIGVVSVVASTLGIMATNRHHMPNFWVVLVACVERLVGQYGIRLPDGVDDFVDPTLLSVGVALIVSTFYFMTRPVVDRRLSSAARSTERRIAERRAREIVSRYGRGTLDYFALRDDKQFFFFRDSLVAYAVYGGVALISPDPVGPIAERAEAFSAFRLYAENRGWTIGVVGASEDWRPIYHSAGLHSLYLGDEAIVDCQNFSLEGGKMKGLRQAVTRLTRHGYHVEFLDPAHIDPAHVSDIVQLISMLRRGEGERGFSMMLGRLFDPKDKGLLLTLVHGPDGRPVAACQFVPSPAIDGYSLDLMRRDPGDHPNGLIDFALCSTIEHLRSRGARGLSLNFAAFRSVLEGERGDGTFTRVERWALRRLSGILPIESLWSFNSKYQPRWQPRYLVYPAIESFVPVVAAVMRAESLTELPVVGRLLANDPLNRPGTVVPRDVLDAAESHEGASSR